MNLKSAQIKRVFYNIDSGGKDLIVLSDYDDEVRRIRQDAADRAWDFIEKYRPEAAYGRKAFFDDILGGEGEK
jgi:hypothetical protein